MPTSVSPVAAARAGAAPERVRARAKTERFEVDRGRVQILPDWSAATANDGRSFARQMVDAIEASLLSRASSDQLDLVNATLADRGMTRDKAGLITLRNQMKAEVLREEQAEALRKGLGSKSKLLVRFAA